jgi:hypothetical protein
MKKMTLVAGLLLDTQLIYSQQTIPTSGVEAASSGGLSSYTVGQLVYTINTGSGSVIQGAPADNRMPQVPT